MPISLVGRRSAAHGAAGYPDWRTVEINLFTFSDAPVGHHIRVSDRDDAGEIIKSGVNVGSGDRWECAVVIFSHESGLIATYKYCGLRVTRSLTGTPGWGSAVRPGFRSDPSARVCGNRSATRLTGTGAVAARSWSRSSPAIKAPQP